MLKTEKKLKDFLHYLSVPGEHNHRDYPGYSRVDALGAIFNKITVEALGKPENFRPANAPTSYPFLWGAVQSDFTQWTGSSPNRMPFGKLARNVGEAIGMFGEINLNDDKLGYESYVDIAGLKQVEDLISKLKAPKWPEEFSELNLELIKEGRNVFVSNCAGCHSENYDTSKEYEASLIPVDTVATDNTLLTNMQHQVQTGKLAGRSLGIISGRQIEPQESAVSVLVHAITGVIIKQFPQSVASANFLVEKKEPLKDQPASYKARPLNAIWATAPYLHNGSVPNLRALLEHESKRPKKFYVGSSEFDPINVGFMTNKTEDSSLFDTRKPGSSNRGHNFGVDLNRHKKNALIEYLKSL